MTSGWIEHARESKKLLVGKRHGELERTLLDAGWTDANTARRAIAAVEYLDKLRRNYPEIYRATRRAPFSIVELLARWNSFDPDGASKMAIEWAESGLSVRTLAKELAKARKLDEEALTKEDLAADVRDCVKAPLMAKLNDILPGKLLNLVVNFKAPASPPVDYHLEQSVDDSGVKHRTVCVLIVGPYGNPPVVRC